MKAYRQVQKALEIQDIPSEELKTWTVSDGGKHIINFLPGETK